MTPDADPPADAERVYQAWCARCGNEAYLASDSSLDAIQTAHATLCEAGCPGRVYHRVVDDPESAAAVPWMPGTDPDEVAVDE